MENLSELQSSAHSLGRNSHEDPVEDATSAEAEASKPSGCSNT